MNKPPWTKPTENTPDSTTSGMDEKYCRGSAPKSNTRNDTPSIMPTPRTRPTGLLHTIRTSHSKSLLPLSQLLCHFSRGSRTVALERRECFRHAERATEFRPAARHDRVE